MKGWHITFVTLIVVLTAVGINYYRDHNTREDIPREAQKATNEALYRNCKYDRRFRVAYRERGVVERKFLRIQLEANEALIEVTNDLMMTGETLPSIVALGERLDALNAKLSDLREAIAIYPLPKCGDISKRAPGDEEKKRERETDRARQTGEPSAPTSPGSNPTAEAPSSEGSPPTGGDTGGGSGGGNPVPSPPSPSPTPNPPAPTPPSNPPAPPSPSPPSADKPPTVGGLGVETPVDPVVCNTAPVLCE